MNENTTKARNITRFGQKLCALRTWHKLTQQELARVMGFTAHGYISELEKGKKLPTVDFVLRLARLFQVTTDALLKDELELEMEHGPTPRAAMELAERESDSTSRFSNQSAEDRQSEK